MSPQIIFWINSKKKKIIIFYSVVIILFIKKYVSFISS